MTERRYERASLSYDAAAVVYEVVDSLVVVMVIVMVVVVVVVSPCWCPPRFKHAPIPAD